MLAKVKAFTLFNNSVHNASIESQRKVLQREATIDRAHTYLYILTVLAEVAGLSVAQFAAPAALGRVAVANVPYGTYLYGLPADAICTPAAPLVAYGAFAAVPVETMTLCTNAPQLAAQCAATPKCNNYDSSAGYKDTNNIFYSTPVLGALVKYSSSLLTLLCASANTTVSNGRRDLLAKTLFTPTVASPQTLGALLNAEATTLLLKARSDMAAVIDARRLFDKMERPISSAGLSLSSNHFAFVTSAINGAVPPDTAQTARANFFSRIGSVRTDYLSTEMYHGGCASGFADVKFVGGAVSPAGSSLFFDASMFIKFAMMPGCVPWVSDGTIGSGARIIARSTTCTAASQTLCEADKPAGGKTVCAQASIAPTFHLPHAQETRDVNSPQKVCASLNR